MSGWQTSMAGSKCRQQKTKHKEGLRASLSSTRNDSRFTNKKLLTSLRPTYCASLFRGGINLKTIEPEQHTCKIFPLELRSLSTLDDQLSQWQMITQVVTTINSIWYSPDGILQTGGNHRRWLKSAHTWYLTSYLRGSFRKYWNCSHMNM
jgi:hypothetical protein